MQEELNQLKTELLQKRIEVNQNKAQTNQLKRDVDILRKAFETSGSNNSQMNAKMKSENETVRREFNQTKTELKQEIHNTRNDLHQTKAQLKKEVDDTKNKLAEMQSKLDQIILIHENEMFKINQELEELRDMICLGGCDNNNNNNGLEKEIFVELTNGLEKTKDAVSNKEIDRLDSEISDLKDELEDTLNNSEKESTLSKEYERKKFKKICSDKVAPLKQKIVNKPQSAETISPSQFQFIPVQPLLSLNQNERKSHSTASSDPNKNKKYKLVALEYDISDFTQDPPLKPLNQNSPSESTPQIPPSNKKQNKKNNKKIPRTNEQPLLKTQKQLQALATKHDIPLQFVTDIYTSRSRQLSLDKTILSVWSFDWDKYAIQANATHQEWPYLSIACKIAADITGFEESYIKTILSITTRHLRYKDKKEKHLNNQ